MYRDAENYKVFGCVVFRNPDNAAIPDIEESIRKNLISGEFIEASKWKIPDLFFITTLGVDHGWCEFEELELSNESPTDSRTIQEFLEEITQK
jgi:hypothetical protein